MAIDPYRFLSAFYRHHCQHSHQSRNRVSITIFTRKAKIILRNPVSEQAIAYHRPSSVTKSDRGRSKVIRIVSGKQRGNIVQQFGNIGLDNCPNQVNADFIIIMDKAIAHSRYFSPLDLWVVVNTCRGEAFR